MSDMPMKIFGLARISPKFRCGNRWHEWSPPIAAVSDSFTLSGMVDKTVFVIRWEQTPRNVALATIRQMVEAGADIGGIVVSRVDVKKHARYGYADSGYYQGSYRKYYVN